MMFNSKVLVAAALTAFTLSGCAVAGAGIFNGAPNQTSPNGQNGQASDPKNPVAVNTGSANKLATTVVVNTDSMILLAKRTEKLQATVTYADGSKDGNVAWSTTDSTIVSVNPTTGEVSGVAPGVATIQAKSASTTTVFANVTVTVKEGAVQDLFAEVTPSTKTLAIGETVQMQATLTDSSTKTSGNGTWSSSNQQIAFINDAGLVTARKAGKCTITFTSAKNPSVTATATITVTDPAAQ